MKRYLAFFAITPLVLITIISLFIYFFNEKMPAPRLSSSESFNEKARWIKNNLSNGCDIVIAGSSMALNNVDGHTIKNNFSGYSVLNIASWGLNISESKKLLEIITKKCESKLIIYSAYYADFDNQGGKNIEWELLESYLNKDPTILTYLKSLDVRYYFSTFISRDIAETKLNKIYHSLIFDGTGSVLFDCNNFEINNKRWDAHKKYKKLNDENIKNNLFDLENIQEYSKANNIKFVLIKTPLRPVANKALLQPEIKQLWIDAEKSTRLLGGEFIDMQSQYAFTDDYFTDFAHLNKCGAQKAIEFVIPILKKLTLPAMESEAKAGSPR